MKNDAYKRYTLTNFLGKTFKAIATIKGKSRGNVDGGIVCTNIRNKEDGKLITDHVNFFGSDARTLAKHIGKTVTLSVRVVAYNGRLGLKMA